MDKLRWPFLVGAIIMTQLFALTSVEAAPRIGLGIAAVLTLAAGLVSALRIRTIASKWC